MTEKIVVTRANNIEYGTAANGLNVGSGWDCDVKRLSRDEALVNVMRPNGSEDYLVRIDVESDEDLQDLAISYAQCPYIHETGYLTPEDDGWSELAKLWDSIEVL